MHDIHVGIDICVLTDLHLTLRYIRYILHHITHYFTLHTTLHCNTLHDIT